MSMTFEPLIPSSLWIALAAAAAALLAWYAMRRPPVIGMMRWAGTICLMGLSMALVLAILLNPIRVEEVPPPAGKPLLTVLVDTSASMATADLPQDQVRFDAAARAAERIVRDLSDRFEVRVRGFADAAVPSTAEELRSHSPGGQTTDLGAAIASCLDQDRPQGQAIAILSDGIHNVGGAGPVLAAVQSARAMATPIYTSTYGTDVVRLDLGISLRTAQDLAFVGQQVPLVAQVSHTGLDSGSVEASLWFDGRQVQQQTVQLAGQAPGVARFMLRQEQVGLYCYEVRVEALPGETTQANNSAWYLLRVVDQPVRVLVLEGKPYWDFKFLMRALSSVPAVELDGVVRMTEGRLMRRTVGRAAATTQPAAAAGAAAGGGQRDAWQVMEGGADFLARPAALKDYQVVVLGRDTEVFLSDAAVTNLQRWISREGGSLVCYRGAPTAQVNERLARLLPVKWTPGREMRFRMRLTDQGRDLQWLGGEGVGDDEGLAGMPTLASTAQLDRSKPLAVVLASAVSPAGAQQSPAIIYQPYGSGRVAVIEGAGMWRWAFLPAEYQQAEPVYDGLWQSMLRWLISSVALLPGQQMALRPDSITFGPAEAATATLLMREELGQRQVPAVELIGGGLAEPRQFAPAAIGDEPGVYRVDFGPLPEGQYEARIAGAEASDASSRAVFQVRSIGMEQLHLRARPDLMARIATDSGGAALSGDLGSQIAQQFEQHMRRVRPPRVQRTTAWDRWWVMAAVVGAWGCCWMARRTGGLV
jgi:hypothetical protein